LNVGRVLVLNKPPAWRCPMVWNQNPLCVPTRSPDSSSTMAPGRSPRSEGRMDEARDVAGCHTTREARVCNVVDDAVMASGHIRCPDSDVARAAHIMLATIQDII